ncbi:S1C family serine protease [Rubrobacter indicoceani]|uniref:S1C family serine protease n=1 Tax=Rubrobacter indicoceani TaxID=2051957 RepID=UPI0013C418BF|nr:S1C family serine protease [Rubrobacter indicoceani]
MSSEGFRTDTGSEAGGLLGGLSREIARVVEGASASVVTVVGGRGYPGSGVVYGEGLVLSSLPAVGDGEGLSIADNSGEVRDAELVGYDHRSGLALLRAGGLEAPALSPAAEEARIGEIALSLGRPGGVRAGFGIVGSIESFHRGRGSGRGRGRRSGGPVRLRLDSAPYPGLGGGAVLSASSGLLGVVVAGGRNSTFAVPARVAWEVASRLEGGGSLRRGYLGIYSQPVSLSDSGGGLLVAGVLDDTPASEAGILVGDIVTTLDGHPVTDSEDLMTLLQGERVGLSVPLGLIRGGVPTEVSVRVAERRPESGGPSRGRRR